MKPFGLFRIALFSILFLASISAPAQWTQSTQPSSGTVNFLYHSDPGLIACTSEGLFLSRDNGKTWNRSDIGMSDTYVICAAATGINLYAGTEKGVFMSTNSGVSWRDVNMASTVNPVLALTIGGSDLIAATSGGVYRLINNGKTWIEIGNTQFNRGIITCFTQMGTDIVAGTDEGGVFLSKDNGANWSHINPGSHDYQYITSLTMSGSSLFVGTSSGVYRMTQSNGNWTETPTSLIDASISCLLAVGSSIFATAYRAPGYCEILVSAANGEKWTNVTEGLFIRTGIMTAAISGSDLFVGTKDKIWRRPLNEMTILGVSDPVGQNVGFRVSQNYPNPFVLGRNDVTTISYNLPKGAPVTVEIYDALGRRIQTLVDEYQDAGSHSVAWNGRTETVSILAAGVYRFVVSSNGLSLSWTIIVTH